MDNDTLNDDQPYDDKLNNPSAGFLADLRTRAMEYEGEIAKRNQAVSDNDQYIYSDRLERMIDIPIGHDFTPVNWLRRTVEIHKTMFMGRPFAINSRYDVQDLSMAADDQDMQRRQLQNKKEKEFAEGRRFLIDSVIADNGGHALFSDGAESCSAVGTLVLKTWYDTDNDKFVISPVEAVENCYAFWSADDFRKFDFFVYAYQISKQQAASLYRLDEDELLSSPLGSPFLSSQPAGIQVGGNNSSLNTAGSGQTTGTPMVTILEGTGKLAGWGVQNGKLAKVPLGGESPVNCLYVGNKLVKLITDPKKIPKYYILPNKRERRRAWGVSDISKAAINLNVTYIETFSDWRTVASKVNFPKYKGFNFGPDTQTPKFKPRKIELLPLSDGQDMQLLNTGNDNDLGWERQLSEIQKQYIRETGVSQVLFDSTDISLNSNQALLTSMKPTSDIAENKKQIWAPILTEMFADALRTIAIHRPEVQDLVDGSWNLTIQWPTLLQKEDPIHQQMLLNRFNAKTMSLQSFLEAQGETREEIDRIRDEMEDPLTAAVLGNSMAAVASHTINSALGIPPWGYVVPKVQLRGDLTPGQEGNLAENFGFNSGIFPPTEGPQGYTGQQANDNLNNQGFIQGQFPNQTPVDKGPPQVASPANNTPGSQPVSQPGSGATAASPQGALNQQNQNQGG